MSYFYFLSIPTFLALISPSYGWSNWVEDAPGHYTQSWSGSSPPYTVHTDDSLWPAHLRRWWEYSYTWDFSSHDWLALEALNVLKLSTSALLWKDSKQNDFWTSNREKIFLYATAGPDVGNNIRIEKPPGIIFAKMDVSLHNYRFDPVSGYPIDNSAGIRADDMARNAIRALKDGDCNVAAFWMGNMAHYIADICLWFHVSSIGTSYSSRFETRYAKEMRYLDYSFFINKANSLFVKSSDSPSVLVQQVAYNARFGVGVNPKDADWMHNAWANWIGKGDKKVCTSRIVWQSWKLQPLGSGKRTTYEFFTELENRMGEAIQGIASAMAYVSAQAGAYTCKADLSQSQQSIYRFLNLSIAFMLFSYLGLHLAQTIMKSAIVMAVV